MKRKNVTALVMGAFISLLALTGCDTPVGDEGYWLADVANPFIGTWGLPSGGMTTGTSREFRNDGTFTATTINGETTTTTEGFYLVKDDFLILSQTSNPYYARYRFTVFDNNTIRVLSDGSTSSSYQTWVREGDENSNADRTITLSNGLDGFWRSDSLDFGREEGAMFMYDYHSFSKNGTFHSYHYMNKQRDYLDRGESSYFIDSSNRLVALSAGYTVRVYYNFTKNGDDAFSWATTDGGYASNFERFDGETFWRAPPENDPFTSYVWEQSVDSGWGDNWDFRHNSTRVDVITYSTDSATHISTYTLTPTSVTTGTITFTPAIDGYSTNTFTYTFTEEGNSFTVSSAITSGGDSSTTFTKWGS